MMQAQQQQKGGAGGAGGAGGGAKLQVAGCQNPTVASLINGNFQQSGENHNKPVFKKEGPNIGMEVLIYFWDERDGPNFSGWWFGPKVGGDQVWAYNPQAEAKPPAGGWKVPWDGEVDASMVIRPNLKRPLENGAES